MSQMITGCSNIYGKQVIQIPTTEIVVPRFKNLVKHERQNKRSLDLQGEQVVMMRLVKKLGEKQLQQIKQMKVKLIYDKYERLKRKMRKSAEDRSNQNTIQKFFKVEKSFNGSALTECMAKQRCEQIQISKKYGTKIFNNLATIHEIAAIEKQKQNYRSWLNTQKNSSIKSPIFTRMNFVLEHVKKQKDSNKMITVQNAATNRNSLSVYQINRKNSQNKVPKYVARQKEKKLL